MIMRKRKVLPLVFDFCIIALSVMFALWLIRSGTVAALLSLTKDLGYISSFVSGLFFTSAFTTAPAMVALGEVSRVSGVFPNALFGALGAVVGDLVIFYFIRDHFAEHIRALLHRKRTGVNVPGFVRPKIFRWFTFLVGGAIIASPLPDEIGIGLMGFSKMRVSLFVFFSLIFNFIGILLIGGLAHILL